MSPLEIGIGMSMTGGGGVSDATSTGPVYGVNGASYADLFQWGEAGYGSFQNPAMIRTAANTLIVFAQAHKSLIDATAIAIASKRSTDNGKTWSNLSTVITETDQVNNAIGNLNPVVDSKGTPQARCT